MNERRNEKKLDRGSNGQTSVSSRELLALRREAARLRLAPPQVAHAPLAGPYLSRSRGRGMEFDEVRGYQPGDEVRHIDWRVTARTGRVHSKLFSEERERPVLVVLDMPRSMHFGTRKRFKSVAAARAAAVIAWSAAAGGDRVGGLVTHAGGAVFPPRRRRRHLHLLFDAFSHAARLSAPPVLEAERRAGPESSTRTTAVSADGVTLGTGLGHLRRIAEPGSKVFVVSDFYDLDDEARAHMSALARSCDVTCVRVVDPLEQSPPPPGRYRFSDGLGTTRLATASRAWRDAYSKEIERRRAEIDDLCRRRRIALVELRTDEEPADALARGEHAGGGRSVHDRAPRRAA